MNLSSHVPTSSSSAKSPVPSKGPGILIATGKPGSRMRRNSKSDAASSSQVRPQDAYRGGLMDAATVKPVATKEESGDVDLSESQTGSEENVTGGPVAEKQQRWNPMHPVNQTTREVQKLKEKNGHTIYTCLQPQFTIRKQSSRSSGRSTDENMTTLWLIWTWIWLLEAFFWMRLFEQQFILDKTMRWIYDSWRILKTNLWNSVGLLFRETGKRIIDQNEITGVSTVDFKDATWMSTSLLCEKAYQITDAKAYVFSDSVLCVGKWEMILLQLGWARLNGIWKTITSRIWIESTECRRSSSGKCSQESQRWASSRRFKVWWETYSVNLSTWKTGSSSCQRTTTLHGMQKEIQKDVIHFTDSCGICS